MNARRGGERRRQGNIISLQGKQIQSYKSFRNKANRGAKRTWMTMHTRARRGGGRRGTRSNNFPLRWASTDQFVKPSESEQIEVPSQKDMNDRAHEGYRRGRGRSVHSQVNFLQNGECRYDYTVLRNEVNSGVEGKWRTKKKKKERSVTKKEKRGIMSKQCIFTSEWVESCKAPQNKAKTKKKIWRCRGRKEEEDKGGNMSE